MPQPQTPHYPRHGSLTLATWQHTYANTGHHRRNAGCPGPRTRNKLSNMAPPACKPVRTTFEVCHDPVRAKGRHKASSATATRRSQPRRRRQNKPHPTHGLVLEGPASQLARPNDPSRQRKRPQCRRCQSQSPRHAHSSRWRNVTPCTPNGQMAQKYKGYSEPRSKDNQISSYGSGAR